MTLGKLILEFCRLFLSGLLQVECDSLVLLVLTSKCFLILGLVFVNYHVGVLKVTLEGGLNFLEEVQVLFLLIDLVKDDVAAILAGSSGTSSSMNERIDIVDTLLDDNVDIVNVKSSCGYISGDKDHVRI